MSFTTLLPDRGVAEQGQKGSTDRLLTDAMRPPSSAIPKLLSLSSPGTIFRRMFRVSFEVGFREG